MNDQEQRILLDEIKAFIESRLGKQDDVCYRTGEEGQMYSQYASTSAPWISFEGPVNELLNYGDVDKWAFKNDFDEFLAAKDLYYEMGESWNMSIYS